VLAATYAAHPERFVKGRPHPADLPQAVWINPPAKKSTAQNAPGLTIAASHDLRGRPDFRLVRSAELPDHRNRRDSNCRALNVVDRFRAIATDSGVSALFAGAVSVTEEGNGSKSIAAWRGTAARFLRFRGGHMTSSLLRASAVCTILSSYACGQSNPIVAPSPIAPSPTAPSPTLSSISVAIGPASQPSGQPQRIQMIATGRFSDMDRDLTSLAEWQYSNPDVGTLSTTGLLIQAGPGTATITATYQGKSGSLTFATTYPFPGPWDY
jgi:hypothetical protein